MPEAGKRRKRWWIVPLAVVATIDLSVRFLLGFPFEHVLWTEAVLFLAAGILFFRLALRATTRSWARRLQMTLAAAFVLGALRAGLWGAGLPVTVANATILIAGAIAVGATWHRTRRQSRS